MKPPTLAQLNRLRTLSNGLGYRVKPNRALQRRSKAPEGECKYCDDERRVNNNFHPPHDASGNCESGKRDHCSCDTCF